MIHIEHRKNILQIYLGNLLIILDVSGGPLLSGDLRLFTFVLRWPYVKLD
jgi:hypothetical protein